MMMGEDGQCLCDPCYCETPGEMSPLRARSQQSFEGEEDDLPPFVGEVSNLGRGFNLTEFMRAKEYFLTASTNSGLSVYDHLSEVIRKMLDDRAPNNPVDFVEEISMNIKRYRFGMGKDLMRDAFFISPPILEDASQITDNWKKHALWSVEQSESAGEDRASFGGFPNLMRLLYYLEQVNVGLPRDEMFRIALAIRQLTVTHPISRARFWGKIFGIQKNYYVVEAELKGENNEDLWNPPSEEPELPPYLMDVNPEPENIVPGAGATFQRAGEAVTDPEILTPYAETSGLPPGETVTFLPKPLPVSRNTEFYGEGIDPMYMGGADEEGVAEAARWEQYQNELMTGFPEPIPEEIIVTPSEGPGAGINRRAFYVCNDIGDKWFLLPDVNPQQINVSRNIRWFLSGILDKQVQTYPDFPGLEGHYLRALLARATAGSQVSPRGYYKTGRYGEEEEGEDEEEYEDEEEETPVDDKVFAVKKFRSPPMPELLTPSVERWVHHTSHILRQGRTTWWNPSKVLKKLDDEEEEDVEEEEEEEIGEAAREFGPRLFASLADDKTLDGTSPWSARASSTVFTEFQVASVRSNLWPGATAMCTNKGKVENIYFGDGLKFNGRTYAPQVPEETQVEYREGPELTEATDPTVEEEQAWLAKLQLDEIADIEDKFVDNEEGFSDEDEDEEESDADDD